MIGRTIHDGNVIEHPEAHYLDFVIDEQRLGDRLPLARGLVTLLNREWLPTVADSVLELLGRRPASGLDPGRIYLFVCSECGDLGCGAITAAIEVAEDCITWSQFAWESGYRPADPIEDAPTRVVFDVADYETTVATAYERVATLPHDELQHQRRNFLWPWQWGWRLPKDGH